MQIGFLGFEEKEPCFHLMEKYMSLLRVVNEMVMTESGLIPLADNIKAGMDAAQDMINMDVEIQNRQWAFASLLEEMGNE